VSSRRPLRSDRFDQLRGLRELDAETVLERRDSVVFDLEAGESEVALDFEGRRVTFPGHVREEVEGAALSEGPFRAADLPGNLDEEGRLVLIRRLVREGFLRIRPDE
jgi:hypothetical protein